MWRERRIGVLAGGLSEEAKVSMSSGSGVLKALQGAGLDAVLVELGDDVGVLGAAGAHQARSASRQEKKKCLSANFQNENFRAEGALSQSA